MGVLTGELIFETVRFLVMILLLVCGVLIGGKLRAITDARKAKKKAAEEAAKGAVTD
ncbi:MAG: hypothetical protein IJB96_12530 [Lachnospira sp.]|nr:hypothetical protein [Lachnospira sp.]